MLKEVPSPGEPIPVEETWEQLRLLLLYLYPEGTEGAPGKAQATQWAECIAGSPGILDEMNPATMKGFLEVTRKYGCESLLQVCSGYLCSDNFTLSPAMNHDCNVLSWLVLAQEYSLPALEEKCATYLMEHLADMAESLQTTEGKETAKKVLCSMPHEDLAGFAAAILGVAAKATADLNL
ncbi:hypothetical protein N2152v2_010366 [Parachlorella kessleri]